MDEKKRSRKWLLTINNPQIDNNMFIMEGLYTGLKLDYACSCLEIGEKGTKHMHIFVYRYGAIRFRTVKEACPRAHIDFCHGSVAENVAYVAKTGIHSDKACTQKEGSFCELGTLPGACADDKISASEQSAIDVLDAFLEGKTPSDVVHMYPQLLWRYTQLKNFWWDCYAPPELKQAYEESEIEL